MGLNLQEMAQSAFSIINQIQNTATELVGIDALWCRATPEPNSEDVILQEYTLTQIGVEQPKPIKILTSQSDYNPGNFTVDLFGINYDAPLEVSVTIETWKNTFGADSMPQAGDVVYIKLLHKLFEVKTSNIIYSIASMPTYYKCQLSKYNPTASRKETDEFKLSIDELTVSQEELFGDAISQEVADNNIEVETAYNTTSYVDPMKEFDMESIVFDQLIGPDGNRISNVYYDFRIASQNVVYHTPAHYLMDSDRPHWVFSCWFKNGFSEKNKEYTMRAFNLFSKDKKNWYFKYATSMKLKIGDRFTLTRGSVISISGEVVELPNCGDKLMMFNASDMNRLNKKMSQWYEIPSRLKISAASKFNIISSDNETFGIDFDPDNTKLIVTFGQTHKEIKAKKVYDSDKWMYLAIDFASNTIETILSQITLDGMSKFFMNEIIHDKSKSSIPCGDFDFNTLSINAMGSGLNIRNIRLYENEYEIGDTYKIDMFSEVTRNASKLIVVDAPNVPEKGHFISPVR